jgi:hypothetical protein
MALGTPRGSARPRPRYVIGLAWLVLVVSLPSLADEVLRYLGLVGAEEGSRPTLVDVGLPLALILFAGGLLFRRRWAWFLGMTLGAGALLDGVLLLIGAREPWATVAVPLLIVPGVLFLACLLPARAREDLSVTTSASQSD